MLKHFFVGGKLTTKPCDCSVLITDKIRRTAKFLCAMGRGIPIVSQLWLTVSKDTKAFQGWWIFALEMLFIIPLGLRSSLKLIFIKGYRHQVVQGAQELR